ncbi:MAG: NADH:flavin oxidoreductase/NADH oxidase [Paludibacteraceae bacterium]
MNFINQPLTLKNVTLKNRIGMSPMCMYSSVDGFATDWHLVHYGTRAIGGVGLIMQEATAVAPEGRITPFDLGIWKDEHIPLLKKITEFITSYGAVPGIQLGHAGRKASHDKPSNGGKLLLPENGGWQTAAPSAIPFSPETNVPTELTENGIREVIGKFAESAQRAVKAGYKIIEIHAAHGYLIQEFLSPVSNHRTDNYGGSFENRIRILLDIVDAVKSMTPGNMPLFVRVSATEWTEGGWTIEETVNLAKILIEKGVDLMDCSTGGNIPHAKIPLEPLYQVPFAEAVHKTGMRTAAIGLITDKEQVNTILEKEQADIVMIGRELLRNPYFALQAGADYPLQYLRAK